MAKSNRERVGTALDLFVDGMMPFVERELESRHGDQWKQKVAEILGTGQGGRGAASGGRQRVLSWDTGAIVDVIQAEWQHLFRKKLGKAERSMLFEIKEVRNAWAHQESFSTDDTYRAVDTMHRVL